MRFCVDGERLHPVTFLTGIYGMNFDNMPKSHQRRGYPGAFAAMTATAVGILVVLQRKGRLGGSSGRKGRI